MSTNEQEEAARISDWKSRLPDDLVFGTFEDDFLVEGRHYRYGAWNTAGDWWLAWNTEEEFQRQICELAREQRPDAGAMPTPE